MGDCEVDVDSPQNIISFCTGYGGIELGLRRAGVDVRVICNVEIEAFVQANLVAKIEEGRMDDAPIYSDLKTFPARIFRGKIHGIIGGYPCQPFSSAGKRKGEKDPRHLWPYIREHVRAIRPLWCFFENVRGHTTMGLWRVLSDLEEDGYQTEWGLFSAEETGAPHQRIRCFILAYRNIKGLEGFNGECSSKQTKGVQADIGSKGGTLGNSTSKRPHRGGENCKGEQSEVLGERLESDEELAYSPRGRFEQCESKCEKKNILSQGSEKQLAHTTSREPWQSKAWNGGQDTSGGSEEELGDTTKHGRGSRSPNTEAERVEREGEEGRLSELEGGCIQLWPARPGEEQHDWEEPRVTEAQSELGGATNGTTRGVDPIANRVDRLRLLGNGVVSQCAEIAWRTLWKEMNNG